MATDPVCGMKGKNEIESEYNGRKYYFCREECKAEFEKNPVKYTR
jgi:YHS domain-containing protein